MRRQVIGSFLIALVAATALAAPAASSGRDAFGTRATGSSLTLTGVVVDRRGIILPESWSVPEGGGSAQFTPPFGQATYRFAMPKQIPAGGASITLSVSVTAAPTSRFAPALGILGEVEIKGEAPFQVGALAEPGQSAAASKKLELVPRAYGSGALVKVIIGLQDGPRITYQYRAAASPTTTPKARKAIDWAKSQLGSRKWTGRCQGFVQAAYGAPAGFCSAKAASEKFGLRRGPVTDAPPGALVYFKPLPGVAGTNGHVGLSLGGGKIIHASGAVKITDVRDAPWSRAYIGWVPAPSAWPGRS